MPRRKSRAPDFMAASFAASATVHMVRPQVFEPIMPRAIPAAHHRNLIYVSGLAEYVCALGLFRRKPWAVPLSIAVLLAVLPANMQMALDAGSGRQPGPANSRALAWGRLPLQGLMIWAVLKARGDQHTATDVS